MKTKLTAEALKVVLVVDFLSRSSQGISKVSFDYKKEKISYKEAYSKILKACHAISSLLVSYEDLQSVTEFKKTESLIKAEKYVSNREKMPRELIIQFSSDVKNISDELRKKYNLVQEQEFSL